MTASGLLISSIVTKPDGVKFAGNGGVSKFTNSVSYAAHLDYKNAIKGDDNTLRKISRWLKEQKNINKMRLFIVITENAYAWNCYYECRK